jgi:hypothetical protein
MNEELQFQIDKIINLISQTNADTLDEVCQNILKIYSFVKFEGEYQPELANEFEIEEIELLFIDTPKMSVSVIYSPSKRIGWVRYWIGGQKEDIMPVPSSRQEWSLRVSQIVRHEFSQDD